MVIMSMHLTRAYSGDMHRALSVPDVIREISQYLIFKDLVHFSQINKFLRFTNLELLWQSQQSMTSLLGVLPEDLVVPGPLDDLRASFTPSNPDFADHLVSFIPFDLRILRPDMEATFERMIASITATGVASAPDEDPDEIPVPGSDQRILVSAELH